MIVQRHWLGVACVAALFGLTGGALAQIRYSPSISVHPIITPMPTITTVPSLTAPTFKPTMTPSLAPTIRPTLAAPLAAPVPTAPVAAPVARAVRFRCEAMPQDEACRERSEAPDGDSHDDECNCSRDYCYPAPDGNRICEKLQ
jgi:hypothetical protein